MFRSMVNEQGFPARALGRTSVVAVIVLAMLAFAWGSPAQAAGFTVDDLGDAPDAAAGNGACADASGKCTLRAAIHEANALAGDDQISFAEGLNGTITLTNGWLSIEGNLTITGPGADELTVSGGGKSGVFSLTDGLTVSISDLTVADGSSLVGGGINAGEQATLTVLRCIVRDNTASARGGGIYVDEGTTATVQDSILRDNTAGQGGGVYVDAEDPADLMVRNSVITGNDANGSGEDHRNGRGDGGGIAAASFSDRVRATVTVQDSTISGNGAAAGRGGGIYGFLGARTTIQNSTISDNHAALGGAITNEAATVSVQNSTLSGNRGVFYGGIDNDKYDFTDREGKIVGTMYGTLTVQNSTITGNPGFDLVNRDGNTAEVGNSIVATGGSANDVAGAFTSRGHNLIGAVDGSTGFTNGATNGDKTGTQSAPLDPKLGPLADNGGPTQTHALLSGSPAIDAGDPAFAPPPEFDQRGEGYPRKQGARLDIGAFEVVPPSSDLSVTKSGPAAVTRNGTIEYNLSVANAGPGAAGGVTLTDTLPGTTVFASLTQNSGPNFDCSTPAVGAGGTVSCTSASLPSGASSTFTLAVTVPEETNEGTEFTNTATVESETSDPDAANNSSSATTSVVAPEPGALRFDEAAYAVDEDAGTATITVVREGGSDGEVRAGYATADGTATAGSDYTATGGTLAFADGDRSETFVVRITDDTRDEPDETVELALSNPQGGATLGAPRDATLTIADNDAPPPPDNRAPVASGDSYSTTEDEVLRVGAPGVLGNDSDPDGDSLAARAVTSTRHGRLALKADGSFVYTPEANFSGADSFTYRASDGKSRSQAATVKISVRAAPEPDPRGCTIVGTAAKDRIVGTSRADVICALGGNDAISGLGGNDTIHGDAGIDAIAGGRGDDRLYGGPSGDELDARDGSGGDLADGGRGGDTCSADRGDTKRNCQ